MVSEISERGIDNRFVRPLRDKFAPVTVAFRVNANQLRIIISHEPLRWF